MSLCPCCTRIDLRNFTDSENDIQDVPHVESLWALKLSSSTCSLCNLIFTELSKSPSFREPEAGEKFSRITLRGAQYVDEEWNQGGIYLIRARCDSARLVARLGVYVDEGWFRAAVRHMCFLVIDFCTDDHVAIPQSVALGRQINPPQQGFELVKEWIRDCENNHSQCATRPAKLPTRVINVGIAGGQEPALKVASSGDTAYYITLSHCWGRKPVIKTTKATLQSHLTQLPMASLPNTFRDAITITRTLGIRYLWIDSLCIIQDDANDWEKESAVMGQIYAHSYLTIAAAASIDSSGGCFLQRPRDTDTRIKCSLDDGSTGHVFLRPKPKGFHDLENSFLQTRAWVAQERLLSSRSIHYDVDQIMWECKETRLTEDCVPVDVDIDHHQGMRWDGRFQLQYPRYVTKWSSLSIDFVWDWYAMIDNYTTRNLTNPDDKLPALSGIASVMASRTGEKYVAGLWESHINIGMLWKRASTAPWLKPAPGYR
jgi:hypothetical protein